MQYMKLPPPQRDALLASLAAMPELLAQEFANLPQELALRPGADGAFSPVEHVWHLADLEREGFGERIRRLQSEDGPHLPDFDGARIAAERDYRALSMTKGLRAFATARRANLAALPEIDSPLWQRAGTQEGVGRVSLCDVPAMMEQHDASHRAEIAAWRSSL
jgi:hypothetical protein